MRFISVHPHACGELVPIRSARAHASGSSPRMWGTPSPAVRRFRSARFIPTHVGNSADGRGTIGGSTVHPHACGELQEFLPERLAEFGSSPRMWGTLEYLKRSRPIRPVHPHACGELGATAPPGPLRTGSSPRMWGTHSRILFLLPFYRFIPTHVGNSTLSFFR